MVLREVLGCIVGKTVCARMGGNGCGSAGMCRNCVLRPLKATRACASAVALGIPSEKWRDSGV